VGTLVKSGFQESSDKSLQFLYWLKQAKQFNEQQKGNNNERPARPDLPDLVHEATLETIERVRLEERARIIKLLELGCERPLDPTWEHYRESCNCYQIELIKGETNDHS